VDAMVEAAVFGLGMARSSFCRFYGLMVAVPLCSPVLFGNHSMLAHRLGRHNQAHRGAPVLRR
jgi:hypothetical protein